LAFGSRGREATPRAPSDQGAAIFHWFGYYDKLQFDPSSRYVLGMEVSFEHRLPEARNPVRIGMVDTGDSDRWIDLGESYAWCWQQGCMLQWLPGSDREVVFNDRERERFVGRILDTRTGKSRTLPAPIYALSPDGRTGIGCNFSRLWDVRPGYGYPGLADPDQDNPAPTNAGVYSVDLRTVICFLTRTASGSFFCIVGGHRKSTREPACLPPPPMEATFACSMPTA
jgi:hypothetical protein